jgi:hypothetical protein
MQQQQQQQQNNGSTQMNYPFTNVQIAPNGMLLTIMFSPTISFNVTLDQATCHEIAKNILLQEKQQKDMLDIAQRAMKGKQA